MKSATIVCLLGAWTGLWFTTDQQAQRLFNQGEFESAAKLFRDPMRQGAAWFRNGDFQQAEQAFARVATAEAEFNRGNCLIMQGKYDAAVERFDRALSLRPDWDDAEVNRSVAAARAKQTEKTGGDMGDQKIGADEVVFDKSKKSGGQDTDVEGEKELNAQQMQELWLRKVQTKPADFLRSKFAYQLAEQEAGKASE